MSIKFNKLFSPFKIGYLRFKNRIVRSPMYTGLADESGCVTDRLIARYARIAKGGAGLVIVEASAVNEFAIASPVQLRIDSDSFIPGLKKLASSIKRNGAVPGIQLFHAGRYALLGKELLSSSDVPLELIPDTYFYPRAMQKDEIEKTIVDFVNAGRRAIESGFEVVEIHGAGGYLVSDFFSPRSNRRTDEYGNNIQGRIKFPVDLMKALKGEIKDGAVCGFRLMVDELLPGGVVFEDAIILAEQLIKNGADYLNPLPGTHESYIKDEISEQLKAPGFGISYSRVLKKIFPDTVILSNWRINSPEIAEEALRNGDCDAVALGRPLLADPDFPSKAERGFIDRIIKCTSCYHCYYLALQGTEVRCKQWEKKKAMDTPE